jgi:adenylate cyclase
MNLSGIAGWIVFCVLAALAFYALFRLWQGLRLRALLRAAFCAPLPTGMAAKIARHPSLLKLDGQRRGVTYLACTLRGLAEAAASEPPTEFLALSQQARTALADQARLHHGVIDRLDGDGLGIFWNAPLEDADSAARACAAANAILQALAAINLGIAKERRLDDSPAPILGANIGIASGEVIVGGVRGGAGLRYQVQGEAVARARRLCVLSPRYGVPLADEATRAAAEQCGFLEVDRIALAGKTLRLQALQDNPATRGAPKFRALATFHDHIFTAMQNRQWDEARALVAQCRNLSGANQGLYDLYLARIGSYEVKPPPPGWDGFASP